VLGADPVAVARENALSKARGAVLPAESGQDWYVLGTDTVVATEEHILGKPADREAAAAMLAVLQGREHQVISAVALRRRAAGAQPRQVVDHATTAVRFCSLSPPEIESYLDTGEWHGKAGAYAIQGVAALFIEEIRGEYANVVGLPLHLLTQAFRRLGFDLLRRQWIAGREQV
jgi:septum formation protein